MITYLLHQILLPLSAEDGYWVLKTEGVWVTGRKKTDRHKEPFVEGWWQRLLWIRRKFCCNISDYSPVSVLLCLNIPKVVKVIYKIPPFDYTTGLNPASVLRELWVGYPPGSQECIYLDGSSILAAPCQHTVHALWHQQFPMTPQRVISFFNWAWMCY